MDAMLTGITAPDQRQGQAEIVNRLPGLMRLNDSPTLRSNNDVAETAQPDTSASSVAWARSIFRQLLRTRVKRRGPTGIVKRPPRQAELTDSPTVRSENDVVESA
jgi:hypothetical protein